MLRPRDEQWERIQEHIPEEHVSPVTMVVPIPARKIPEAVLWILCTGAQRLMLPQGSFALYENIRNSFDRPCSGSIAQEV
jgi:hypothetical protein